jgi:hypothetical protein
MTRAQLTSTVEQNTGGAVAPFVAGKNKIINGDFGIWQRGTNFTSIGNNVYTADRWCTESNGTSTVTQQTFTGGSAPVAGYAGQYFLRQQVTSPSTVSGLNYRIEDIRTLSGQTATISFWAKAASTTALSFLASQFFVAAQQDNMATTFSIGTSWQRYTFTGTIGSISGYTLPNPNFLSLRFLVLTNTAYTLDIWGVQLEAGSVATPFTTATGTFQGELAACQRYFAKSYSQGTAPQTNSTTNGLIAFPSVLAVNGGIWTTVKLPSTMRTSPTVTIYSYAGSVAGSISQESSGSDFSSNSGLATQIGDSSFAAYNGSGASITPTNGGMFHYVATAEL